MKWLDTQEYGCLLCGHIWIIMSTKFITNEQHISWSRDVIKQHRKICNDN